MKLFRRIPMKFEENEYEIRILYDDATINVVAFLDNHPANGYRHQVKLPKACAVEEVLAEYAVDELVDISKNDIAEGRWDKLSRVIQRASSAKRLCK